MLRVKACAICGSDLASYEHGLFVTPGQVMGHEFSGEVAEVGKDVEGIAVGDRVAAMGSFVCGECFWCQRGQYHLCPSLFTHNIAYGRPGAMAEYVKVPDAVVNRNVFKLPDHISFEEGAGLEPLSVACFAAKRIRPEPGDSILVLGAGMVGLCLIAVLNITGEFKIIVSEKSRKRLAEAQRLGVAAVVNPDEEDLGERVRRLTGEGPFHFGSGSMTDIVVDCAGVEQTVQQALQWVRSGGKVLLVGLYERETPINLNLIIHKDISLMGSLGANIRKALSLLEQEKVDLKGFFTHSFELNRIKEALEMQANAEKSIKVVINP